MRIGIFFFLRSFQFKLLFWFRNNSSNNKIDLILCAKQRKNENTWQRLELNVWVLVFIKYDTGLIETAKGFKEWLQETSMQRAHAQ